MIDYHVEVEHEGGAELSFRILEARELAPNDIVRDSSGRSYVAIATEVLTTVDSETGHRYAGHRYGRATARPTL